MSEQPPGDPIPETPTSQDPTPEERAGEEPTGEEEPEQPSEELDERHAPILERLGRELGDGVVEWAVNHGNLVVRVQPEAWERAARVAKEQLHCDYLSFVSAIDWQPAARPPAMEGVTETSSPVQPDEMTFGVAGSRGRFQVFACVRSTSRHHDIIFKTDVEDEQPVVASWTSVYPGANWHERECWEMFGISFAGHPHLSHLYLPGQFEGHPLRKDFPLLAREVKPWPGLVDVELMPGADDGAEATAGAEP